MRKIGSRLAVGAAACLLAASLGGCADIGPFPRLGAATTSLKQKVLSSEEQAAAIRELSLDQANQRKAAEREIEKP